MNSNHNFAINHSDDHSFKLPFFFQLLLSSVFHITSFLMKFSANVLTISIESKRKSKRERNKSQAEIVVIKLSVFHVNIKCTLYYSQFVTVERTKINSRQTTMIITQI